MIQKGSRVKIHYTLMVDGKVVESTAGEDPLSFVVGTGEIMSGLEEQLTGLQVGDKRGFQLSPEKGYGNSNPEAIQKVPKSILGLPENLKTGDWVSGNILGKPFQGKVVAIESDEITLDLNHQLVGKTLDFDIEVVEVQ